MHSGLMATDKEELLGRSSMLEAMNHLPAPHLLGWPVAGAPRHLRGAQNKAKNEAKQTRNEHPQRQRDKADALQRNPIKFYKY